MGDSMSTIINATTTNGVVIQPDNSGSLVLQTNSGTTALTIDTSQRAAFVAGTALLPAITTTGDTNTGMFFPAADTIAFAEGGTEAMRIDSSGNVGIGTVANSGYAKLAINASSASSYPTYSNPAAGGFNGAFFTSTLNSADSYTTMLDIGGVTANTDSSNGGSAIRFLTQPRVSTFAPLERMRIDSSGLVSLRAKGTPTDTDFVLQVYADGTTGGIAVQTNQTSGRAAVRFRNPNGVVGQIETSGSSTSYATSSDYRLKENIAPMTGALAVVGQLKPCTYIWKSDGSDGQGFIAHELAEVVPDCVTGEKDAVETYIDEDGVEQTRPKYQGIDTSFLVATLTAAIQELKAIVDAQAIRIETLEAK
jgi:hypothetical protein